ncbi:MAG TPA: hypothetical protein VGA72_03425 [Anaerolineales bacterium]
MRFLYGPRQSGAKKTDKYVWERVCEAINKPEISIARAQKSIDELRAGADALSEDQERIQKELDAHKNG